MNILQKLSWFPGKILNNVARKRALEEAYAETFVNCYNGQFGTHWVVSVFQSQPQKDITDVLLIDGPNKWSLQLVHGDMEFEKTRPYLKNKPYARFVEDVNLPTSQIRLAIEKKRDKYKERARGHTLLIHGGPFDYWETIAEACKIVGERYVTRDLFFDQVWYLYQPSNRVEEYRVIRIK